MFLVKTLRQTGRFNANSNFVIIAIPQCLRDNCILRILFLSYNRLFHDIWAVAAGTAFATVCQVSVEEQLHIKPQGKILIGAPHMSCQGQDGATTTNSRGLWAQWQEPHSLPSPITPALPNIKRLTPPPPLPSLILVGGYPHPVQNTFRKPRAQPSRQASTVLAANRLI